MASSWNSPLLKNAIASDVPAIKELLNAAVMLRPDYNSATDAPEGAILLDYTSSGFTIKRKSSSGTYDNAGKLLNNTDMVDGYHASATAAAGRIPVYNSNKALPGDLVGNAGSASKLYTERSIDTGGIATTSVAMGGALPTFNGTANMTVRIDKINISSTATANSQGVEGKLPVANGGTGRSDGQAQGIVMSIGGSEYSSKAYGETGLAVDLKSYNANNYTIPGKYFIPTGKVTTANNFPIAPSTPAFLEVKRYDSGSGTSISSYIIQRFYYSYTSKVYGEWIRYATGSNAVTWSRWNCLQGISNTSDTLVLYVDGTSGGDDRTGLDSTHAVKTITRALEIADSLLSGSSVSHVKLCLNGTISDTGKTDGNVSISGRSYFLQLCNFSGDTDPSVYDTASKPAFTSLSVYGCQRIDLYGIDVGVFNAYNGTTAYFHSYTKFTSIISRENSYIVLQKGTYELNSVSSAYGFRALFGGTVFFFNSSTITVSMPSSVSKTTAFMQALMGGSIQFYKTAKSMFVAGDSAVLTTPKQLEVTSDGEICSYVGETASTLASYMFVASGSSAVCSLASGAIINGVPYGTGSTTQWLRADGTWQTIGTGNASTQGLLKLSDSTSSTSGVSGGIAATPAAVKAAYDAASSASSNANTRVLRAGDTMTGGLTVPFIELSGDGNGYAYVDFHYGNSSADYTARIIASGTDQLELIASHIWLNSTKDAAAGTQNSGGVWIGNPSGAHLAFDANEIMAKASGTTTGTLYIQHDGGETQFGGIVKSTGHIYGQRFGAKNGVNTNLDFDMSYGGAVSSGGYYLSGAQAVSGKWYPIITTQNIGSYSANYANTCAAADHTPNVAYHWIYASTSTCPSGGTWRRCVVYIHKDRNWLTVEDVRDVSGGTVYSCSSHYRLIFYTKVA